VVGQVADADSLAFVVRKQASASTPAYEPFLLCTWKPRALTARYIANRSDSQVQVEYLDHISNFVARQHWDKSERKLAAAEKEKQKAKAQMADLAKKEALMPELAAIVASINSGSVDVLGNLNVKKLKELLKYFFGSHGLSTLKKRLYKY
jgi:hypothetical protein